MNMTYEERQELVAAAVERYFNNEISEEELRITLGKLGLNSTEIEDHVYGS